MKAKKANSADNGHFFFTRKVFKHKRSKRIYERARFTRISAGTKPISKGANISEFQPKSYYGQVPYEGEVSGEVIRDTFPPDTEIGRLVEALQKGQPTFKLLGSGMVDAMLTPKQIKGISELPNVRAIGFEGYPTFARNSPEESYTPAVFDRTDMARGH